MSYLSLARCTLIRNTKTKNHCESVSKCRFLQVKLFVTSATSAFYGFQYKRVRHKKKCQQNHPCSHIRFIYNRRSVILSNFVIKKIKIIPTSSVRVKNTYIHIYLYIYYMHCKYARVSAKMCTSIHLSDTFKI